MATMFVDEEGRIGRDGICKLELLVKERGKAQRSVLRRVGIDCRSLDVDERIKDHSVRKDMSLEFGEAEKVDARSVRVFLRVQLLKPLVHIGLDGVEARDDSIADFANPVESKIFGPKKTYVFANFDPF